MERPRINIRILQSQTKKVFGVVLIILIIGLLIFPLASSFNDILTRFILNLRGYRFISEFVVPQEVKWVVAILRLFRINAYASGEYIMIKKYGNDLLVEVIWNCVGWQSLVMFLITSLVGLQKRFTFISKLKAIFLGFLGTMLVNILRITAILLLLKVLDQRVALVFHDYAGILTNTGWLLLFWWFSYTFILDEKDLIKEKSPTI